MKCERKLTQQEIDWFPGDSSVNAALFIDGNWYYGDDDGDGTWPVSSYGRYIPVPSNEEEARKIFLSFAADLIISECGGDFYEAHDWLSDGDATLGDSLDDLVEEWLSIHMTYKN